MLASTVVDDDNLLFPIVGFLCFYVSSPFRYFFFLFLCLEFVFHGNQCSDRLTFDAFIRCGGL